MEYEKTALSLVSILAGWMLAQLTGVIKDKLRSRRVRKYLLEELDELKTELNRTLMIYSRTLQIYAKNGFDSGIPSPLSNHIFSNYYREAVISLNKNQRISYQLIHTLVNNVNSGISELRDVASKIQEKNALKGATAISEKEAKHYGNVVMCQYINAAMVIWHIQHHLSQPKNPDLTIYSDTHEEYLKYLDNVEKRVSEILESAKSIPREKFEKKYNPETFSNDKL